MNETLQTILNEHIPYRLEAIGAMQWACDLLISRHTPEKVQLHFDDQVVVKSGSFRFFTNPILEIGSVYSRVLLEFLGITASRSKNCLVEVDRRVAGDVGIENFPNLSRLSTANVLNAPFGQSEEIERACITTIAVANKAVAHLTKGGAAHSVADLRLCSQVVPWLILKHVYEPLGAPRPEV